RFVLSRPRLFRAPFVLHRRVVLTKAILASQNLTSGGQRRLQFTNILSLFSRRFSYRRIRLDSGIHLRLEEVSDNETACTILLPTDCSDGRPSDTEELLQQQHDHHPTTPIPPPAPPTPTPPHHNTPLIDTSIPPTTPNNKNQSQQLNFEGFECDVSVENGGDGAKDRQEFSFTLYDFDGHGKITKDDIAGLVTTIYETLGSSIKVPHYGSKTIKVKLTVSPDQSGGGGGKRGGGPGAAPGGGAPGAPRYKRDLNVTIRERRPRRHHRRRHSVSSSAPSEDREADVSDDQDDDHDQPSTPPLNFINSRLAHPGNSPSSGTCCGRNKKRSSSLQRQELLQIIQANMEKNNLNFQTSRKHCNLDTDHQPKVLNNEGSPLNQHLHNQHAHSWREHCSTRKRAPEMTSQQHQQQQSSRSPHHLKHRHREQEQARAMAQVVRWLEQEFTPSRRRVAPHHNNSPSSTHNHNLNHSKLRHEHHHIHEYIHHHYHHYQDTSVVV
ncbi:hypothetical protein LSTR_LSTR010587, partial [Laodelphax striatellus]